MKIGVLSYRAEPPELVIWDAFGDPDEFNKRIRWTHSRIKHAYPDSTPSEEIVDDLKKMYFEKVKRQLLRDSQHMKYLMANLEKVRDI